MTENDILEKTFTTFHASNMLLQQQYRERQFTKYSELIACLLVAEKNNELLMKNHQARPTGTVAIPEVNSTDTYRNNNYGRGRGRARGRGRGRGYIWSRGYNFNNGRNWNRNYDCNNVLDAGVNNTFQKRVKYDDVAQYQKGQCDNEDDACYRCGGTGHWSVLVALLLIWLNYIKIRRIDSKAKFTSSKILIQIAIWSIMMIQLNLILMISMSTTSTSDQV